MLEHTSSPIGSLCVSIFVKPLSSHACDRLFWFFEHSLICYHRDCETKYTNLETYTIKSIKD